MLFYLFILFVSSLSLSIQDFVGTNSSEIRLENVIHFADNNNKLNLSTPGVIQRKNDSSVLLNETKPIRFDDFKPSPQFGNGLDFGFAGDQQSRSKSFSNNWGNAWPESQKKEEESSIEAPWKTTTTKVKFPSNSIDRPYQFENYPPVELNYNQIPNRPAPVVNPIELSYNQHPILPLSRPHPSESIWNKLMGFTGLEQTQKSFFGPSEPYHSSHHESHYGYHHEQPKEYHHSVGNYHGGGMGHLKKILKVLAAIVPIGLFLSALTPTIITVSSANNTLNRNNRKADPEDIMEKITASLNSLEKLQQDGCEQRVFCELMVNAMFSKNAEEHVKNLLNNFVEKEGNKNEETFAKILEAVKNQDCSPIICMDKVASDLGK